MGQTNSAPRFDEAGNTLGPRVAPSPTTYAKFIASQSFDHLPPDSRPQFSHDHHTHYGPANGIYDCPQKSDKTEHLMGHCFTVRPEFGDIIDWKDTHVADGNQGNEVFRLGARAYDGHLLTEEEPVIVTKGDLFGILFFIFMCFLLYGVAQGLIWVWKCGVKCRADRQMRDLEARARCVARPLLTEKDSAKARRLAFCGDLCEELRMSVKRHVSDSQEREKWKSAEKGQLKETYKDGEYVTEGAPDPYADSAASSDVEDEEEWSEVDLEKQRGWAADFNGDLIMLGT